MFTLSNISVCTLVALRSLVLYSLNVIINCLWRLVESLLLGINIRQQFHELCFTLGSWAVLSGLIFCSSVFVHLSFLQTFIQQTILFSM